MGRSSLPILNRTGSYLRWYNVWDDKNYFSIKYEEDIFINFFLQFFLNEILFLKKTFGNFQIFTFFMKNKSNKYNFNFTSLTQYINHIQNKFIKLKKKIYFMRFNILRFNSNYLIILKMFIRSNIKTTFAEKQRVKILLHKKLLKYKLLNLNFTSKFMFTTKLFENF